MDTKSNRIDEWGSDESPTPQKRCAAKRHVFVEDKCIFCDVKVGEEPGIDQDEKVQMRLDQSKKRKNLYKNTGLTWKDVLRELPCI